MIAGKMVDAYPQELAAVDPDRLVACIEACVECAQACTACADACLAEDMVAELTGCIRRNLDCADVCAATGNVLSRRTAEDGDVTRALLTACATLCGACADECGRHTHMSHCVLCADACRACAQACHDLVDTMR